MKIKGRSNTIVDIALDLPRTFPALSFFQQGGPSHHLLRNVLEAYTLYRPDVGYVQGMSYIAALLLLYMDAEDAFVALCNLLNRSLHYCFYRMDIKRVRTLTRVIGCVAWTDTCWTDEALLHGV